jgi:hypothetical protein
LIFCTAGRRKISEHLCIHFHHSRTTDALACFLAIFLVESPQLSRDPNSLANLDQDLPNYAQHSVPIFSLPQEWLWCETWCSNDTKKAAKTIDLCNNPMTKEPKLDQAKRIVSEWVELDELRSKTDRDGADAVTSS